MSAAEIVELRLIVHGWVQGVGFRATARQIGLHMRLCGAACNKPDGTVEVRVQGPKELLETYWDRLSSENFGRIDRVEKTYTHPQTFYETFSIVKSF